MTLVTLDEALADRKDDLTDVKINVPNGMHPVQVAGCDPEGKSFTYHITFYSASDRNFGKQGAAFFISANDHEQPWRAASGFCPAAQCGYNQNNSPGSKWSV